MNETAKVLALAAVAALSAPAWAHGDKLDSHGCHKARGAGGYHCHKGPFAGKSFQSKEEMLQALARRKSGTPRRP